MNVGPSYRSEKCKNNVNRNLFVNRLLKCMSDAANITGDDEGEEAHVCKKLKTLSEGNGETRVLHARFALGGDDGTYLRTNVMPLYAACSDKIDLTSELAPAMERARLKAIAEVAETRFADKINASMDQWKNVKSLCEWLLSMPEVRSSVMEYLSQNEKLRGGRAVEMVQENNIGEETDLQSVCDIIDALLNIFGKPMDAVQKQWEHTLGDQGTGTQKVHDSIKRLSAAIRHLKGTKEADELAVKEPDQNVGADISGAAAAVNIASMGTEVNWRNLLVAAVPLWMANFTEGYHASQIYQDAEIQKIQNENDKKIIEAYRNTIFEPNSCPRFAAMDNLKTDEGKQVMRQATVFHVYKKLKEYKLTSEQNGITPTIEDFFKNFDKECGGGVPDYIKTDVLNIYNKQQNKSSGFKSPPLGNPNEATNEEPESDDFSSNPKADSRSEPESNDSAGSRFAPRDEAGNSNYNTFKNIAKNALAPLLAAVWKAFDQRQASSGELPDSFPLNWVIEKEAAFCYDANPDVDEADLLNAVCAAMSQLREDGGVDAFKIKSKDNDEIFAVRVSGASAQWRQKGPRTFRRGFGVTDWWSSNIWPNNREGSKTTYDDLLNEVDSVNINDLYGTNKLDNALVYSLNRGLCGYRAPHHKRADNDQTLMYNIPKKWQFNTEKLVFEKSNPSRDNSVAKYSSVTVQEVDDFVGGVVELKDARLDPPRHALWSPAQLVNVGNKFETRIKADNVTPAVAEASVYEHLIDFFKSKASEFKDTPEYKSFYMACAAAAKLSQLKSMTTVAKAHAKNPNSLLCDAFGTGKDASHLFITRPVMQCPDQKVLYPCDAGLAAYKFTGEDPGEDKKTRVGPADYWNAFGQMNGDQSRVEVSRSEMTGIVRTIGFDTGGEQSPLYIAPTPGTSGLTEPQLPVPRNDLNTKSYPRDESHITVDKLEENLRFALELCKNIEKDEEERATAVEVRENIEREEKEDKKAEKMDMEECDARTRREAVWNDGLREASIAGDRLYAFVRQLSGAISESVDVVCQIDEGQLVRQQQQMRDRRSRATERAAQEHAQLVRNVFSSVIKDSEFILGIQGGVGSQDIGELKVVSNTLRKQAQELTTQGSGSEGFFTNAVKLEQLLTKGTGEMSLKDLFGSLRDAGLQMQHDAVQAEVSNAAPPGGASLEFLSAPRNSLILRYKPEALSAIREAYDIFCKEMAYTVPRWRFHPISAYELMEGADDALTNAFAVFCGHKLAHARMFASAHVGYVAQWPARANNTQLKIALRRLTVAASAYMARHSRPNFESDDPATARSNYFR